MVGEVGFEPTTYGQFCYHWVFYLNILWFPISSAYIFIITMFGTLGEIIFIHSLRSTVIEYLFAIIQFTSVLTSYSLHRFYRILLGHFTQNRRANPGCTIPRKNNYKSGAPDGSRTHVISLEG